MWARIKTSKCGTCQNHLRPNSGDKSYQEGPDLYGYSPDLMQVMLAEDTQQPAPDSAKEKQVVVKVYRRQHPQAAVQVGLIYHAIVVAVWPVAEWHGYQHSC